VKKYIYNFYISILKFLGFKIVHFLHIRKNAGTSIANSLIKKNQFKLFNNVIIQNKVAFLLHNHGFTLVDVKDDEFCFFVYREPVSRYISGFNSRLRKGAPTNYNEWTKLEEKYFSIYNTAEELAVDLASNDSQSHERAKLALQSIGHINTFQLDWVRDLDYLRKRRKSVLFVARQKFLDQDLRLGFQQLGLNWENANDDIESHAAPSNQNKKLSEQSIQIIKDWYSKDYELLDVLKELNLIVD
jgi:hypothetical protein